MCPVLLHKLSCTVKGTDSPRSGCWNHSLFPGVWGDPICGLVVPAHLDPGTILTGWLHHPPREGSSLQRGAGCRGLWGEPATARGAWGGWLLSPLISAAEVTPAGNLAARQPEAWLMRAEGISIQNLFGKMSPGTGSISSCHCRPIRQHRAATAW